ncbi:hypothetical protein OAN38_00985 [Candidatus Marinimicrobia bacterium]|jgi:hypothetical protein|nr:hypothetical protein [Candidatus Neomarinimicrobiota bacterium]MDC0383397.1 hypothetical protein [Candidatus Neomarinimicrobiota bacterium]
MSSKKSNYYLLLFLSFISLSTISAQLQIGEISPDFSAPICANSDDDLFNLYQLNGSLNGGDYKVVWLNLFTSW